MTDLNLLKRIESQTKALIEDYEQFERCVFEEALRINANPPVKGVMTKGKLKWRGISISQQGAERWLCQRGQQISPKVSVNIMLD